MFVALVILFIIWALGAFTSAPFANYIMPDRSFLPILAVTNLLFVLAIPVLGILLLSIRLLFHRRVSPQLRAGMVVFWFVNLFSLLSIAGAVASQFNESSEMVQEIPLSDLEADTLRVELANNPYRDMIFNIGPLQLGNNMLVSQQIELLIKKTKGPDFELTKRVYSRGVDREEALEVIEKTDYPVVLEGSSLTLLPYFTVPKGEKYRGQFIQLTLKVPQGKYLDLTQNAGRLFHWPSDISDWSITPGRYRNEIWRMEEDGLVCMDCDGQAKELEEYYSFSDFERISIAGSIKVNIKQGEQYQVIVSGREKYVKNTLVEQAGPSLFVRNKSKSRPEHLNLDITLPKLVEIDLEETEDVRIVGFNEKSLRINSEGHHNIDTYVDVDSLTLWQRGHHKLVIHGQGRYLKADMEHGAELDAKRYAVNNAAIKAIHGSQAALAVSDTLTRAGQYHRITFDGKPVVIDH